MLNWHACSRTSGWHLTSTLNPLPFDNHLRASIHLQQDVTRRLDARRRRGAADFAAAIAALRAAHAAAPFAPAGPVCDLEAGVVYLDRIDAQHRRHYGRTPAE